MRHYGDITQLRGDELPVVDVITGGSPCQDLSVAGNRAGLAGERSGLFMEQMRIVKEMREADERTGRTGFTENGHKKRAEASSPGSYQLKVVCYCAVDAVIRKSDVPSCGHG